mmetsp:Transcript_34455/g.87094  ORF Transcript_34455/g.87094 Transcript_34455/m.87094 type:complete len:243 (-) Transcript_34455:1490-2218(-)
MAQSLHKLRACSARPGWACACLTITCCTHKASSPHAQTTPHCQETKAHQQQARLTLVPLHLSLLYNGSGPSLARVRPLWPMHTDAPLRSCQWCLQECLPEAQLSCVAPCICLRRSRRRTRSSGSRLSSSRGPCRRHSQAAGCIPHPLMTWCLCCWSGAVQASSSARRTAALPPATPQPAAAAPGEVRGKGPAQQRPAASVGRWRGLRLWATELYSGCTSSCPYSERWGVWTAWTENVRVHRQ